MRKTLKTTNKLKESQGSTLTEVIVGMGTLMFVIAGVFQLMFTGLSIQEKAKVNEGIAQVIQAEVESLRNSRWIDVEALKASQTIDVVAQNARLANFKPQMRRSVVAISGNQRKIQYMYSWTDRANEVHTGRFDTYFSRGGISDRRYRHF